MRVENVLYFAPGIRFCDVDLDGDALPVQLHARIDGFYIQPARACAGRDEAFAAGVLLVCCIDALAHLQPRIARSSGARFTGYALQSLPSLKTEDLAERFYEDVRCGLVHEGRVKNGAQFSLEVRRPVALVEDMLVVNPALLAVELRAALETFIANLASCTENRQRVAKRLWSDFAKEFDMSAREAGGGNAT